MKFKKKPTCHEWLYAEDLLSDGKGSEVTLTIKQVHPPGTIQSADGEAIDEPVIEFDGTRKKYLLSSKINKSWAKSALGSGRVADWAGKKITFYVALGKWFGDYQIALRVRVPDGIPRRKFDAKDIGRDMTGVEVTAS